MRISESGGSQTISPGHYSTVRVSQVLQILMLEGLVYFPQEYRFMSYNLSYQYLHLINKNILGLSWLLQPIVKITYWEADILTGLKSKTQRVYQFLKGLFTFGGQAQVVLHLKPHMLRGVVFHQLNCFTLGKLVLKYIHPYVL